MKLAKELSKRATGRTLYLLDEPTTGLHFHDVKKLLEVLHELVDQGNSVVVIEHNLDVIKTADWIIDLGPEGGDGGGEIVVAGTPEEVVREKRSYTGQFLKDVLRRGRSRRRSSLRQPQYRPHDDRLHILQHSGVSGWCRTTNRASNGSVASTACELPRMSLAGCGSCGQSLPRKATPI